MKLPHAARRVAIHVATRAATQIATWVATCTDTASATIASFFKGKTKDPGVWRAEENYRTKNAVALSEEINCSPSHHTDITYTLSLSVLAHLTYLTLKFTELTAKHWRIRHEVHLDYQRTNMGIWDGRFKPPKSILAIF